jgi:glycosyltransferase involved in cell wall biosynthesis
MRLLLFNLATDIDDPVLGFTASWVSALAERVEFVHVITMREGRHELPGNVRVHSLGKEKGYSEPRRAAEFYRIVMRLLREDRVDVCFSHMMPLFTVMAAPFLKWKCIPIITWYAHLSMTRALQLAHHLSDRMVSSIADAYPYKRDKLAIIGQGINTDQFTPGIGRIAEDAPTILCVSRLSPVKDHPTLIKAAWLLRRAWPEPFRVVVVGGAAVSKDLVYVRALHEQVKQLELDGVVFFEPPVSRNELPSWYHRCAVHVNLTANGSGDKVVLEAMACGKPCLIANEGFRETLGEFSNRLIFRHSDAADLAEKLFGVFQLSSGDRDELGRYLCERVARMHSLDRLAQCLVEMLEKLKQDSGIRLNDREAR